MRRRLLYAQLIAVALLAFLDIYFGIGKEYFWTVYWWDIPLHILGGLWVGLATAWAFTVFRKRPTFIVCLCGAVAVGVAWEIFEYVTGTGGSIFMSYPMDTAKDILDDCIGGATAGLLVVRRCI